MGKFYEKEMINELLDQVSFETILNYYSYPFKGNGKNRGSICPNCQKDHNHFKVNTHANLSNCFVCGYSCNAIQFIMTVENLSFIEALEKLAAIGGVKLESSTKSKKKQFTIQERLLYHAAKFYQVKESEYLTGRGIKQELIQEYQIGFAPGNDALLKHLKRKGFSEEDIVKSGLAVERQGVLKDFFYKCIVFPIIQNGVIIDFYGRHIGRSKVKHIYLYGEFMVFNIDNIDSTKPVIYVESIINALSIMSIGFMNVVAVGGSSKFSKRHVNVLKGKGVKSLYNGYDTGDSSEAGQEGAINSGNLIEQAGIKHRIIELPEDTDINELINQPGGPIDFKKRLLKSRTTEDFELRFKLSKVSVSWLEKYIAERN